MITMNAMLDIVRLTWAVLVVALRFRFAGGLRCESDVLNGPVRAPWPPGPP
jgi:hypothetical protein